MMIKNGMYGSRGWQIMVELNQAHIKGEISSTSGSAVNWKTAHNVYGLKSPGWE